MDREMFDSLTRGVGRDCTRRSALAGLAAGVLGLGFASKVAAQVETERCGKPDEPCFRNTDCCTGLKCRGANPDFNESGRCVDKGGSRCYSDRDCNRDERCIKNRCTRDDQCRQDTDCRIENICSRGRCVSGCRGNQDCKKKNYCDRGRCVRDCAGSGSSCSRNSDCCSRDCYRNRCY
jgi:hypothetical protein